MTFFIAIVSFHIGVCTYITAFTDDLKEIIKDLNKTASKKVKSYREEGHKKAVTFDLLVDGIDLHDRMLK